MSNKINIDITQVNEHLQAITGYTGRNTEGGIDRISVTSDEQRLIEALITRAKTDALSVMSDYKPSEADNVITIDTPSNFDISSIEQIKDAIVDYIVNHVASEWFFVAREVGDAEKYDSQRVKNVKLLTSLLSRRAKPTKR